MAKHTVKQKQKQITNKFEHHYFRITKLSKFLLATFILLSLLSGVVSHLYPNVLNNNNRIAQAAVPTTRDPYQWPFSRDSIWNMPIGSNAQYATAGMSAPDTYAGDQHHIYRLQNPKPTQFETAILPLDDGMISDISSGDSTNRVATVIDDNGDLYQIQPGRRSSPTSNVTGYLRNQADSNYANLDSEGRRCVKIVSGACYLNIKGKGIDGSHWGSGLSSIGGGLKAGDLTSPEDIRHALNIGISGWKYLVCNNGDTNFNDYKAKGFMWPADRNDSYACPSGYGGNLDYFRMGALLALKPDFDINSLGLQTDAAKKMAKAFQNYGGYVTDDSYGINSNSSIFNFTYEKEAATEFKAKYGYDFNIYWDTSSLRQSPFFKDMDKIITQLNVITNNTPNSIGGGGSPRQPLAPCFVGEVTCDSVSTSSSSSITSSLSSTTSSTAITTASSISSSSTQASGGFGCVILGIHPNPGTMPDWTKLDQLERWQTKKNASITIYGASVPQYSDYTFGQLETTWNRGSIPSLSLEFWSDNPDNTTIETRIMQGELDGYFTDFRARLINYIAGNDKQLNTSDDRRLYLRPAHEANGNWYGWSGTPEAYVQAWRRMYNIVNPGFSKSQLQWIWSVNNTDQGGIRAESYYPGDIYVDWLGIDGYNWGKSFDWGTWNSPNSVFDNMLARLRALSPNKPVSINEVSSTSIPNGIAGKNQWISAMFEYTYSNNIRMLSWFNEDKETDWSIFGGNSGDTTYEGQKVYSNYALAVKDSRVIGPDSSNPQIITNSQFDGSHVCQEVPDC